MSILEVPLVVVYPTIQDIFRLGDACKAWKEESRAVVNVDVKTATNQIMSWIKDPNYCVLALYKEDEYAFKGFMVGQIHQYPFTNHDVVSEIAWYVLPEYRGNGGLLMNELKRWAKLLGAKYLVSHILLTAGADNGVRAIEALNKLGFTEFERTFYQVI